MKFIADVMLGRLAKRMRLLGLDVLYDHAFDDNEIIRISLEQERMILTRDTALAARPLAVKHLFIRSERIEEQLNEVLAVSATEQSPLSRCSVCNEPLAPVERKDVHDLVPDYVRQHYQKYFQCGSCKRVFWRGTHVSRMESEGIIKSPDPRRKPGL